MSWAIGIAPVHGDGILVSDVRVTFETAEADCLQKIHYVKPSILFAFAGSVKIGFRQTTAMKQELGSAKLERGWDIDQISKTWLPGLFRRFYDHSEEEERDLGSQIILVAAHPKKSHGGSASPWIDAVKFCSPDFEPQTGFVNQPVFVGNKMLPHYLQAVKEACKQQFVVEMLIEDQADQASAIANTLLTYIPEQPFQIGLITLGESAIANSNDSLQSKLVDTYAGFLKFCSENQLEPSRALA
ncbi:hypothetical protein L0222_24900 [bacterium]|nr:hypothetical protein [bacterium]MCI0605833.1 hypothetical protein [bacterium]